MQTKALLFSTLSTLLLIAGLSATNCFAYQACVKKSGSVRILLSGGSCKKSETLITLNGARQIVDSQGKDVGQLADLGDFALALLEINGTWVNLQVSSSGFVDNSEDEGELQEFFTTTDCSGTAYLQVNNFADASGNPIGSQLVDGSAASSVYVSNGIVYYAGAPPQNLPIQSIEGFSDPAQAPTYSCQPAEPQRPYQVGPMATFDLSTLGFTPPFSIQ